MKKFCNLGACSGFTVGRGEVKSIGLLSTHWEDVCYSVINIGVWLNVSDTKLNRFLRKNVNVVKNAFLLLFLLVLSMQTVIYLLETVPLFLLTFHQFRQKSSSKLVCCNYSHLNKYFRTLTFHGWIQRGR